MAGDPAVAGGERVSPAVATASTPEGDGETGIPPVGSPEEKQPKQRSEDEQTSPASAPFVKQRADARAAANSLLPKASENSIAPPTLRAEAPVIGNADDSVQSDETIESACTKSAVVEEEQA